MAVFVIIIIILIHIDHHCGRRKEMLSRGKWWITLPAEHRSHSACVTSWTLVGRGAWQVHNELTHRFSESVREQILDCLVKYNQTPYQILDVMDPAGRQRLLAFSTVALWMCTQESAWSRCISTCKEGHVACTQYQHSDISQRTDKVNDQVFLGQQQENGCCVTITTL